MVDMGHGLCPRIQLLQRELCSSIITQLGATAEEERVDDADSFTNAIQNHRDWEANIE